MYSIGLILTFVLATLSISVERSEGKIWTYENQTWGGMCDSGKHQSPINLERSKAHVEHWEAIQWKNNKTQFGKVTVKNSGHGFSVSGDQMAKLRLHHGGLKAEYILAQFHYHWGQNRDGSEHRFYGVQNAGELHLVHYHSDFDGLGSALESGRNDALAVVGVMLEQAKREPMGHEKLLIGATKHTMMAGNETNFDFEETTIHDLLPHNLHEFFRYEGSLTTPTCNEQVVWTVLNEKSTIPHSLVKHFTHIEDKAGNRLNNTARYAQPLNSRKVHFNEEKPQTGAATGSAPFLFTLSVAAVIAMLSV